MPFDRLFNGLRERVAKGIINEQRSAYGLLTYCYSRECAYERLWDDYSMMARGLILYPKEQRVVATPFPKFFNVGELGHPIPNLAFETFEKLDGSLIIIFWHDGAWRCATKGSFQSEQAVWAEQWLRDNTHVDELIPGITYLCEGIYSSNRIVIHYDYEGLVLLAAYDETGAELSYSELQEVARSAAWRLAKRCQFESISALIEHAYRLPSSEEGFVIRFDSGLRLKVKGDEYKRIHALIAHCTPLAMWEAMMNGDDLAAIRRDLPEEFHADFDSITAIIEGQISDIIYKVGVEARKVDSWSDKEVGLQLSQYQDDVRPFIFPYRKSGGDLLSGRSRAPLFRHIRPKANQLPGYTPSFGMNRVMKEMDP